MNNQKNKNRIVGFGLVTILSGISGISYEVLYLRMLELYFGNIFSITASILSTFLIGIAFGSLFAKKMHKHLAAIQMFIGVYALGFTPLLKWLSTLSYLNEVMHNDIISIILLLFFPAFLIGTSIPLFSGYFKKLDCEQKAFPKVYSAYNFGAFMSILLVEFVLLRNMPLSSCVQLIAFINIFCGIVIKMFFRDLEKVELAENKPFLEWPDRISISLMISSIFSATFQMFFTIICFLIFSPSHANFSLSIAISILAVSLSPQIVTKLKLNLTQVLVLIPFGILIVFLPLPIILSALNNLMDITNSDGFLLSFLFAFILGFIPLRFYAATIPSAMQYEENVEAESGKYLFWSCLGSTIGYLLFALVLNEAMNVRAYLSLICIVSIVLAYYVSRGILTRKLKLLISLEAVMLLCLIFAWDQTILYGVPIFRHSKVGKNSSFATFKYGSNSVTVYKNQKERALLYNGQESIEFRDSNGNISESETMVGVMAASFVRKDDHALVLGVGTGVTGGIIAAEFKHTDLVEINKAFANFYSEYPNNHRKTFSLPNVNLYYTDARIFAKQATGTYDLVMNNVSTPQYFGACKLFTREFFSTTKQKILKPNGVLVTWISKFMGSSGMKSIVAALHKQFKYCALAQVSGSYYILAASDAPLKLRIPPSAINNVSISNDIKRWAAPFSVTEFITTKVLSYNIFTNKAGELIASWTPNTDDYQVLAFTSEDITDLFVQHAKEFGVSYCMDPLLNVSISKDAFRCRLLDYARHFPIGFTYLFLQGKQKHPEYYTGLPKWFASELAKRNLSVIDMLSSLSELYEVSKDKRGAYETIRELCILQPMDIVSHRKAYELALELGLNEEAKEWKRKAFLLWPFWN